MMLALGPALTMGAQNLDVLRNKLVNNVSATFREQFCLPIFAYCDILDTIRTV